MVDAILAYKQTDDYYKLLNCDELSSIEQIQAEYKLLARQLHPDKNAEAGNQFAHIQRAKEVLTDPELRKQYDQWRRSGIAMNFDDWLSKKDVVKMSMHWAVPRREQPMIQHGAIDQSPQRSAEPTDNFQSLRQRFRSYQI